MATDNSSFTIPVDADLRKRMYRKRLGDDFEDVLADGGHKDELHIQWDDTGRPQDEAVGDAEKGFMAEAALARLFDQAGVDYEWRGGEGEDDFVVNGKTIDVKARSSKCEYRNLIKDYCMSNSDSVDFYFLTNVHYHPVKKDKITAVEFVGYIKNEEFEKISKEVKLYAHNESKKAEVQPCDLKPITNYLDIAQMF